MNKSTSMVIGLIVLLVIIGGVYASMNKKDDSITTKEQMEQKKMEVQKLADEKAAMEKKAIEEKSAMTKNEVTNTVKTGEAIMKAGTYEAYAAEKVMLASDVHDVVLFFRASWCPTCRAVDSDIKANLAKIPSDLTILDVDYDNSSSLKQKYGVTYQHTFVQVDKDGNLIKKWSGSSTLSLLVAEVK
jgi:thiol-disulfide isomerase/thioredoxin